MGKLLSDKTSSEEKILERMHHEILGRIHHESYNRVIELAVDSIVAYNIILQKKKKHNPCFCISCVESVGKHQMIKSNFDVLILYEAPTQTLDISQTLTHPVII